MADPTVRRFLWCGSLESHQISLRFSAPQGVVWCGQWEKRKLLVEQIVW